jgi:outer membrane protein
MKKIGLLVILSFLFFAVAVMAEQAPAAPAKPAAPAAPAPKAAPPAATAPATPGKIQVDLQTVIQKAIQSADQLKEADGDIMMSEGKKMKAMYAYAPVIDATVSYNRLDEDRAIWTSMSDNLYTLLGDIVMRQMYLSAFNPYSSLFPPYSKDWTKPENQAAPGFATYVMPQEFMLFQVDFTLPLWTWWKIPGLNKMAKAGVDVSKEKKRQTKAEVIEEAGNMFFQTLFVRYAKDLVDDTVQRLQATVDLSRNIFEGGTGKVTKTDLLKATIGLSRAEFKAAEADRGWYLAQEALKRYMGLEKVELEFLDKTIFYKKVELDLDQLIDLMLKNRPEWKQVNYGTIAKDANVKVALSEMLPLLALVGEYKKYELISSSEDDALSGTLNRQANADGSFSPYSGIKDYPNPFPNDEEWRVTLAAKIPLSYWFHYPEYKSAKGEAAQMRAKKDWARKSLVLQVKKVHAELAEGLKKIDAAKKIMDFSKERYDLMYKAFQVGMSELGDVIEAQIDAALYRQQYNETVYAYNKSCLEMNKVIGTDVITWE